MMGSTRSQQLEPPEIERLSREISNPAGRRFQSSLPWFAGKNEPWSPQNVRRPGDHPHARRASGSQ